MVCWQSSCFSVHKYVYIYVMRVVVRESVWLGKGCYMVKDFSKYSKDFKCQFVLIILRDLILARYSVIIDGIFPFF